MVVRPRFEAKMPQNTMASQELKKKPPPAVGMAKKALIITPPYPAFLGMPPGMYCNLR
jgi:hypothetical protein